MLRRLALCQGRLPGLHVLRTQRIDAFPVRGVFTSIIGKKRKGRGKPEGMQDDIFGPEVKERTGKDFGKIFETMALPTEVPPPKPAAGMPSPASHPRNLLIGAMLHP